MNEHAHEQLTSHMTDMARAFADLKAAKGQAERQNQELRRHNASLASEVDLLKSAGPRRNAHEVGKVSARNDSVYERVRCCTILLLSSL